ncbi:MAG: restriction endonuclease [Chloroflexi bacterium]|nr:restriction endonuclease [Chloroflexota bacterium]
MTTSEHQLGTSIVTAIRESELTIYDHIDAGDEELWMPTAVLETLLKHTLVGMSLAGLAQRTRSKIVKEEICRILGYPVPRSFKRTKPRFPGQRFDIYVQKSNNLQIWNEEIALDRRFVIVRVGAEEIITTVKVVTGELLATLDKTGTLTQKYQARLVMGDRTKETNARRDSLPIQSVTMGTRQEAFSSNPSANPEAEQLLPIGILYERLVPLIGSSLVDPGPGQDRNRAAELHKRVCELLGYQTYHDDGRFPDVRHQLLEVKLQTALTIDLGLIMPNSTDVLDMPRLNGNRVRHCDVRYVVAYGETDGSRVLITQLFVTNGERFYNLFPQFQGKVINKKLQIPLPVDFFGTESESTPNHPIQ